MTEAVTWEAFAALFGTLITLGGIWWKWMQEFRRIERDLANHKLFAAETYATKAGMAVQTDQILRAIEAIGKRIDGLNERLDRSFEANARR